ncbi:MAG: MFS transporter [Nitrospiraceae bacterium]|nr:MFS transporter [Nitrospiraceae bacterium]
MKKTLRFSILDGVFASGMTGLTQDYFTPFLLAIGGTTGQVGLLGALPNLFASIVQLKSPCLVEGLKSRKAIINIFVFLQALTLAFMGMLALWKASAGPAAFILSVSLFTACGAIVNPAWSSLMTDLVDGDRLGEYFGWRNQVLGFIAEGAAFLSGFILYRAGRINLLGGFAIIFGLAFVFRMISWRFLTKMHEPRLREEEGGHVSLWGFIRHWRRSSFARFVLYVAAMNFAVCIPAPFFPVLMLRDFHFGYFSYTAVNAASVLTIYATIKRWGIHADRVGNMKVLKTTSRLVVLVPLFWLFNHNPVYLLAAQVFSGFVWAGFNLSASNFIYDATAPEKRTRCIAHYNAVTGMAVSLGALTGGLIVRRLPPIFGYGTLTLLLISSILRFFVAISPFGLREVRRVEPVSAGGLFLSVLGIKDVLRDGNPGEGIIPAEGLGLRANGR